MKILNQNPVRIISFNHLDFIRNSFELCPINIAKIENLLR